jgi:hypothetical protein
MKIEVTQVSRRLKWPFWAALLIFAWMSLGGAALWLGRHLNRPVHLCLFKRFTGLACPTCGFTRGMLALLHGDVTQVWLYNPLLFSVFTLFFTATAVRILLGRSLRVYLTNTERQIVWILSFALLFVNWAYVIFYVG